ncbi:MAG: serine/threonine-protein kinase [Verrucomicrobia bacterium]|nr:serine/threonine-protein kinase [Verrucomicrobiota bacterium]
MSAGPIFVLEQFFNEIQAPLIQEAARDALAKGQTVKIILKPVYESHLPEAAKLLSAFEQTDPTLVNFLRVKRKLLESQKWLEAISQAIHTFYEGKTIPSACASALVEAEAAINDQLLLVNARIPTVFTAIKARLPTDYNASLEKVYAELEEIKQRRISLNQEKIPYQEQIWHQFFDLSKKELSLFAGLCIEQKVVILQALLQNGRSMYTTKFSKFIFSLLNSWTGSTYVVMDVAGQALGIGETKIVTRAVELETGKIIALVKPKTLFQAAKNEEEEAFLRNRSFVQFWRESEILNRLEGTPGIISVFERIPFMIEDVHHLFLIEQRYEDGTLEKNLSKIIKEKKAESPLDPQTAISLALQLLTGLSKLHQIGFIHRDIKPDNILCDWTDPSYKHAVICDFNIACSLMEKELHKKFAFSPIYGAPEYVRAYLHIKEQEREELASVCSFSLDIWSMGLVLYQLFFLESLPWDTENKTEENLLQICAEISNLKEDWIPKKFANHRFYPLIKSMLCVDPSKRISASKALADCQRLSQMK